MIIKQLCQIRRWYSYLGAVLSLGYLLAPSLAVAEETIVIGLDADMSAVAAEGGLAIKRGALIAIDEINGSGGVLGRKLALKVRDHRGNPARGLANIEYFAKQANVVAVLGGVHTPVALHELQAIHDNQLVYLGPWAAGTSIVENGYEPNYVFRLSVRDEHAGRVLIGHAKKRGFKKVGLLLELTGWGRSNEKSMQAAAKAMGLEVSGTEWFSWRETDMTNQIKRLIASGVEAIVLVANAPEGAAVVKNMAAFDETQRLPILSHWGIASGSFVNKAGLDSIHAVDINVLQTYSFLAPSDAEKMQKLLERYRQRFDATVDPKTIPAAVGVVHAYDLVHMLATAIVQAGTVDREQVRDAMENISIYEGVFKTFSPPFTKDRHDALDIDDYIITQYTEEGYLVPVK